MPSASKPRRKLSSTITRSLIVLWAIVIVGLLVYAEVFRPNNHAQAFDSKISSASEPLERCFNDLSKTTELNIFYAPDISLDQKQADVKKIRQQIADCRTKLTRFDEAAKSLPDMKFAGYTPQFREAKVNQRQAFNAVGQSTDVMNQYDRIARFLESYYEHIKIFLQYSDELSNLDTSIVNNANIKVLEDQAKDLQQRSQSLRSLDTPSELDDVRTSAATMLEQASKGFNNVRIGYSTYSDSSTTLGFNQVDQTLTMYDGTVVNQPFERLTMSYVPKQVQQLPNKVSDLSASRSE